MSAPLSSTLIKAEALRLGFSACGLAPAEPVAQPAASAFQQWITDGYQADMAYMQNYEEKRLNPQLLVEGARTVISVALNYYPATKIPDSEYQIAWYAYGKDYHEVMKEKLNALLKYIQDHHAASGRVFCDTAPLLERYWAWRAGLGWIGKNTLLIIPQAGSFFFLGEIVVDTEADIYDTPQENRCGNCTRCMQACPTKALETPYRLNAKKCLSYLTIEHRGDLSHSVGEKMDNNIYGCDKCLKACPWNRFATPTQIQEFAPSPYLLSMRKADWLTLNEEQYKTLFKGSAVKRAKYTGLMRNIKATKP